MNLQRKPLEFYNLIKKKVNDEWHTISPNCVNSSSF